MPCMLGKNFRERHVEIFFLIFFKKTEFDISYNLSPMEIRYVIPKFFENMKNKTS